MARTHQCDREEAALRLQRGAAAGVWRHVHRLIHRQLPGASEGGCRGGEGGAAGGQHRPRSYLRESLKVRKGQARPSGHADTGHQQMRDEMEECIG